MRTTYRDAARAAFDRAIEMDEQFVEARQQQAELEEGS